MMTPGAPSRPVLRYHGGKYRLARWIIPYFPPHRVYVEPYCGAASVLLSKPRSYAEVINDLDGDVVTLFRVLRDPNAAAELTRLVTLTPFSRHEFEQAYLPAPKGDVVEQARRLLVRSWMGFSTNGATAGTPARVGFSGRLDRSGKIVVSTGFRNNVTRSSTTPAHDWGRWPSVIETITKRLSGVVIENRPALHLLAQTDGPNTLFYVDPPYVKSTRSDGRDDYRHEMTDEDHRVLAKVLHAVKGMVVLSGYDCPLYAELYAGVGSADSGIALHLWLGGTKMSVRQGSGFRRNRSAMIGYRHDRLPFGLEQNEASPEPILVKRCPRPLRMGFCVVRLCPRAAARIEVLLAMPSLHPDVREVCEGLRAWAEKYGGWPIDSEDQTKSEQEMKGGEAKTHTHRKDAIHV